MSRIREYQCQGCGRTFTVTDCQLSGRVFCGQCPPPMSEPIMFMVDIERHNDGEEGIYGPSG